MPESISRSRESRRPASILVNVPRLVTAYFSRQRPTLRSRRSAYLSVLQDTAGRPSMHSFNEGHILAISQAVCLYRKKAEIDGPLFLGMDTHALSESAFVSTLEVLAANGVETMIDEHDGYTPTPVISHAILTNNRNRKTD